MARSRAYPVVGLEEAVNLADTIQAQLGGGTHDRDSLALALGYSSAVGLVARKIAALVQYGLLYRDGSEYRLTALSDCILTPRDESEKLAGIKTAFGNPPLFAELLSRYQEEGRLPHQLANILSRDHGIQRKVANAAAGVFLSSGHFACAVDSDGMFRDDFRPAEDEDDLPAEERSLGYREPESGKSISRVDEATQPVGQANTVGQTHNVVLSSGVAQIRLPAVLSSTDVLKLKVLFSTVTRLAEIDTESGEGLNGEI